MPPYRAQLGGVFGSGLYGNSQQNTNAGDIIDAVTRGATTLIQGAYARKMAEREQARADAEQAVRTQAEARQSEHDAWERQTHTEAQQRADFESGYSPASTTTTDVVNPGSVESHGLTGPPPTVTAPSIGKQTSTIPAAYDFSASKAAKLEAMKLADEEKKRSEHLTDSKTLIDYRENRRAARAKTGSDSPTVHAATETRAQLSETQTAIKANRAQRAKLAPDAIPADVQPAQDLDAALAPLQARSDSLRGVNDKIGAKLTSEAGVSTSSPTIGDAYAGKAGKPNGSTIRGGGEAASAVASAVPGASAAPAVSPIKKDGNTVRAKGQAQGGKQTISQAEFDALKPRFGEKALRAKYTVK